MIKLLRMQEVAETLQISAAKAYQLAKSGELPCVKFGRSVRVREEDLEKFIEEKLEVSV